MNKIRKSKWFDLKVFSVRIAYLAFLILLFIVISLIYPSSFYISLLVVVLLTVFTISVCIKEIKDRSYRIEELTKSVDIVLKDNLNLIDIPMVMLTSPTRIIWQNNKSKHIIPKEFVQDMALRIERNSKNNESLYATEDIGNGEIYTAIGNKIKFSNFDCMLITFINKTDEYKLKTT